MKSPESKIAATLAVVATLAASKLAVDALKDPSDAASGAEAVATQVEHELKAGEDINVIAGIIQVDGGVNFRSSPVVINTNNTAFITGNAINPDSGEDYIDDSLSGPTVLVRPVIVKNENQLSDGDPEYWLAGLQDENLVWIGVNEETKEHMTAYQLPGEDGEMSPLVESVEVDHISTSEGIVFQSSGYMASSALIREAPEGENDPYILSMQAQGYHEVDLPIG